MSRLPSSQVSVIVATYNAHLQLDCTLRSLARGSTMPREIIVADDGSGPQTKEVIDMWRSRLPCPLHHVWQPDDGFRKSEILNQAIAKSIAQYIVFLDGDCIAPRHFVRDHARLAQKNTFVQARRFFLAEDAVPEYIEGRSGLLKLALRGKVKRIFKAIRLPFPICSYPDHLDGTLGCNLAVWRDALVTINGFNEDISRGWGAEDSELCARLVNLGQRRKVVHGWATVCHLDHPVASRSRYDHHLQILDETIKSKKIRCQNGLDKYTEA